MDTMICTKNSDLIRVILKVLCFFDIQYIYILKFSVLFNLFHLISL